ncbi:MAG: succinylglutamate desuccinylase/aspartoacylase family protein [bacterium]|nr:succinylglutamate desuccinylase/aspartoacylase family protein [bacterium]
MFEEIIRVTGKEKGRTSIILAGVHGNEKCGVEAIKRVLLSLEIERGCVLFGYGNPRAMEKNLRFTEANLNRMFKTENLLSANEKQSYEYSRAQCLKKYLDQADALLDIHASTTLNTTPFIICEENARENVVFLPANLVVFGFDKTQPGGTDYYMNKIGKIGICIECGYLNDPQAVQIAEDAIFAFLKTFGHIQNNLKPKKQSYMLMTKLYITKTNNFVLSKPFYDFEKVSRGQEIGIDGGEEVCAEKEGVILFATNRNKINDEAFLVGEIIL